MSEVKDIHIGRRSWSMEPYEDSRGESQDEINTPFLDKSYYTDIYTAEKRSWSTRLLTMTEYEDWLHLKLPRHKYKAEKNKQRPFFKRRDCII